MATILSLRVDDIIKPFENVSNSTAVMFIQKNQKHEYPVLLYVGEKRATKSYTLDSYAELDKIISQIEINLCSYTGNKGWHYIYVDNSKERSLDAIKNVLEQ